MGSMQITYMRPSIGIIGYGIVGHALAYGFSPADIRIYDKYKDGFESLKTVVEKSEFIFICLPTPICSDESGIDLSIINDSTERITRHTNGTRKIIAIKSTVVPGTTAGYAEK